MQHIKKNIVSLVVILIVLIAIAYVIFGHKAKAPDATPDTPTVTTEQLAFHTIPQTVVGYAQIISPLSIIIRAQVDGYITKVNFTPGQYVKKGQLLFMLRSSDTSTQLKKLAAQAAISKQVYERNKRLMENMAGSISEVDLLQKKAQYEQDLAEYEEAVSIHDITAPVSGNIGNISLTIGSIVTAGQALTNLIDPTSKQLNYQLPSRYVSQVKMGQSVTFTPNDSSKDYAAKVVYISPQLRANNNGLGMRANFIKPNKLLPNDFGQVTQIINANFKSLAIPQGLVQTDAKGFYVYSLKKDKVIKKYFTAGSVTKNGFIEVKAGLKKGLVMISTNPNQLSEGQTVKVSKA